MILNFISLKDLYSQKANHKWIFEETPEWSDEFDQSDILDSTKWTFETGGDGWGNDELQYYMKNDNVKIVDGVLKIIAKKENKNRKKYTSSRIITKMKADWKYGKIEVKAKIPAGRGTWSAIWMLPENNYYGKGVKSGEMDIMENVGYEPDRIHFSIHTNNYNSTSGNAKTKFYSVSDASNNFHVYGIEWTPYGIRGFVDGKKYFEYLNNSKGYKYWPFDRNFFLIMNLAIGGDWGGQEGVDDKIFPVSMDVDYVRVYKFVE